MKEQTVSEVMFQSLNKKLGDILNETHALKCHECGFIIEPTERYKLRHMFYEVQATCENCLAMAHYERIQVKVFDKFETRTLRCNNCRMQIRPNEIFAIKHNDSEEVEAYCSACNRAVYGRIVQSFFNKPQLFNGKTISEVASSILKLRESECQDWLDMRLFNAPSECGILIARAHREAELRILEEAGLTAFEYNEALDARISAKQPYFMGLYVHEED